MIEVACPGSCDPADPRLITCGRNEPHDDPDWIEAEWIRLLACAYQHKNVPPSMLGTFNCGCWTRRRAMRLAAPMGLWLGVRDEDGEDDV